MQWKEHKFIYSSYDSLLFHKLNAINKLKLRYFASLGRFFVALILKRNLDTAVNSRRRVCIYNLEMHSALPADHCKNHSDELRFETIYKPRLKYAPC